MDQSRETPRSAVAGIFAISGAAVVFLLWLVYVHQASAAFAQQWTFLPILNGVFNACSAVALCVGLYFIKRGDWASHRNSMLTALLFSTFFLVSYIANHALHGDARFPGHGLVRTIYLSILASHIFLSIVALPLILVTFFLSLSGRFQMHKRVARFTFPVWLYVSVTGVIVVVFLELARR